MSITSLKNKINKRVKLDNNKQDYQDIGTYLKKKRKELNVTQDSISNGICSISYLSKIENNQIIPKDFYVRELMEKLEVEGNQYQKNLNDKYYLSQMLKGFFYLDDDIVCDIYNEIKDIEHNLTFNICKLAYNVYFLLDDENQYVMMLENLVANMTDYELKLYLLFAALQYISLEKFKCALEVLSLGEKIGISDDRISSLYSEYTYLVHQRLLKKNSSSDDYEYAQSIYSKYHNVKRAINLALWRAYYLVYENPTKSFQIIRKIKTTFLDKETLEFYYLIKASILFEENKYQESVLNLNNIGQDSVFFYQKTILLYEICIIENDLEMAYDVKKLLEDYKPNKFQLRYKVYYHYLLNTKNDELKEYLRDIAIPFSIKIDDYYGLEKYTNRMIEICSENSRYKEALQYYKKLIKEKERVHQILID